jgi:hypothetical protein
VEAFMMRGVRVRGCVLFALAGTCVAAPALASREFPKFVKDAVGMDCLPQCTICHLDNYGEYSTLRPDGFGKKLQRDFDLVATQTGTVAPAIAQAREAKSDVDGDGMLDVDELKIGRDPSNKDPAAYTCGELAPEDPEYGCGGGSRIAAGRSFDAVAVLCATVALAAGAMRARRRTR